MEDNLAQAFEALKTMDWGTDINPLKPIDEAIIATHGDAAARLALEEQLAAVLKTDVSRDAKDFVCRKLMIIGTAASVPTLAGMLTEEDNSHMARYALERIQAPEAATALRDALSQVDGELKIGVIGSLGVRQDTASVPALSALLSDPNTTIVCSAACALGDICTPDAAKALTTAKPTDPKATQSVTDASLKCAEGLLAGGKKIEALMIYKKYAGSDQPKHVRLAATRGMLACAGK